MSELSEEDKLTTIRNLLLSHGMIWEYMMYATNKMTESELVERLRVNFHTKKELFEKEVEIMKNAMQEISR